MIYIKFQFISLLKIKPTTLQTSKTIKIINPSKNPKKIFTLHLKSLNKWKNFPKSVFNQKNPNSEQELIVTHSTTYPFPSNPQAVPSPLNT
jgi:hypothetical protein